MRIFEETNKTQKLKEVNLRLIKDIAGPKLVAVDEDGEVLAYLISFIDGIAYSVRSAEGALASAYNLENLKFNTDGALVLEYRI